MNENRDKVYLASDFHLGAPGYAESRSREDAIVRWIESIESSASEIYLVGDLFDFWFEYKHVVPKGYVRLLGKMASLTDAGIPVHVFTGNHDMWMFDYLPRETGVILHREPIIREIGGKTFMIGHGDGLGPGDYGYKMIKKLFASPVCQWLFARLHPNFGISLANFWSRKSRKAGGSKDKVFKGPENEWLYAYCLEVLKTHPEIDYFIFGHRHLPLELDVGPGAKYFNLGDWIEFRTYVEIDKGLPKLTSFDPS